jgi:peptidoglycan/LPS O-acetylase OafA/YrhL
LPTNTHWIYWERQLCALVANNTTKEVRVRSETAVAVPLAGLTGGRIPGLDLLRGLCAIGVAVYHLLFWNNVAYLYTWGTYGVYIFFVISGASMWVAYSGRFASGYPLQKFLALRFVRLAPLYVVSMTFVLANRVRRDGLSWHTVGEAILNLGFQFGLGNPGVTSSVTGGWSLGIEFVFYLLFPVFLTLLGGRWWMWVLFGAFVTQHTFISSVFSDGQGLRGNWASYTQFLSFVFYFAAGCAIGRMLIQGHIRAHALASAVLVAALAVIALSSRTRSEETLLGFLGVALSVLAVLTVAASAAVRFGPVGLWLSESLGRASYGVYILHPLLAVPLKRVSTSLHFGIAELVLANVCLSIILALIVERWFESPLQRWAKRKVYEDKSAHLRPAT